MLPFLIIYLDLLNDINFEKITSNPEIIENIDV